MFYIYLLLTIVLPSMLFSADDFFIIQVNDNKYDELIIKDFISKMPQLLIAYANFTPDKIEQQKQKIRVVVQEKYHMDWNISATEKGIRWAVGYYGFAFAGWAIYFVMTNHHLPDNKKSGYIEAAAIVDGPTIDPGKIELFRKKLIIHICEDLKKCNCARVYTKISITNNMTRKTYKECGFVEHGNESYLLEKALE